MTRLKKNIFSLFILQGSNYLIPLIIFPYLVRVLGPAEYGRIGLATSIIQYFCLFIDFGFNLTASKAIAVSSKTKEEISAIFFKTMLAKLFLLLLSIGLIFFLSCKVEQFHSINSLLHILCFQLVGAMLLPVWFFQGVEKMSSVTISYILARGLSIPLTFIFVQEQNDINIAALIQGGATFVAGMISIYFVYKTNCITLKFRLRISEVFDTLIKSSPIFIGSIAMSLYTMSNPFILGMVSQVEQVGIYVAADKLRQALMGAFLILGGALYPRVNALFKESREIGFSFVKKIILIQGGLALIASIMFYICSKYISNFMLGKDFEEAIIILKLMSPMIILIVLSVILCNYVLLPLGHNKLYAKLPIVTGLLHLSYAIPLSSLYGASGASLSILITEMLTFIMLLIITFKKGYLKEIWNSYE